MKFLRISLFFIFSFLLCGFFTKEGYAQQHNQTVEAKVVRIVENSQIIEENGSKRPYQVLEMQGLNGEYKGKTFQVTNGEISLNNPIIYKAGDKVVLNKISQVEGGDKFVIADYIRRTSLFYLFALFVVLVVIIGRKRGIMSLLGMAISFAIIFLFILPLISKGHDPILITLIASLFIIPVTFYLSHGFNTKTTVAICGTVVALGLSGILAVLFVDTTHLTGFSSEEAGYINTLKQGTINLQALLLSGILIGLLGVLDDIAVSQSAIVFELHKTADKLHFRALYTKAMDIGKDHIASMVNTLILVYTGAAMPLLLLFVDNPLPFQSVLNTELIAEEIVRTLVASIGLIVAVPVTTFFAAFYVAFLRKKN